MRPVLASSIALGLLALALGAASASGRARGDEGILEGLGAPLESAPARGVQILRPPLEGRVRILGATFVMGSTPTEMQQGVRMCRREVLRVRCDDVSQDFRREGVAHPVTVRDFSLDRTEVPVRAYARCVAAGACAPPGFTPGDARFDRPELPVVLVRWEDAAAYCAFAGGRLPTEAEWELAARGTDRRSFPWGELYNPHLANHGAFAEDDTDPTDGFAWLAPIGSFPDGATPGGILDLSGNAAEWVEDYFDVDENGFGYTKPEGGKPVLAPHGPPSGIVHVVRGGSYRSGAAWTRGASRGFPRSVLPRADDVGFRCAADVR